MKNTFPNPIRKWSLISGISLIIMAIAAGIAYGYILTSIFVPGEKELTQSNIAGASQLYYTGAFLWVIILITDLLVTYGFYRFLKTINTSKAMVSGILRLAYSLILGAAIVFLFIRNPERFNYIWSLGLILFGFHLLATGLTTLPSKPIPKIISILLMIAGCSYSLINTINVIMPHMTHISQLLEIYLALPMTVSELAFGIWLLMKGGKNINPQLSDDAAPSAL